MTFANEPDHHLVKAMLRPGNAPAKQGGLGLPKRPLPLLRNRLDAGCLGDVLLRYLQGERVQVVLCMASNKLLKRHAEPLAGAD